MQRYICRYRKGQLLTTGEIMASSLLMAEKAAQTWCDRNGARFVGISDPVIATEEILKDLKQSPSEEESWIGKTAVERLAKMTGKTEGQVREELKNPINSPNIIEERKA